LNAPRRLRIRMTVKLGITEEEKPLAERYEIHCREVFSLLADGVNRLLTFMRVEKEQFWLNPLEIDLDSIRKPPS
jgi:hypothetical protein